MGSRPGQINLGVLMIALVVCTAIYIGTLLMITWVDLRQTQAHQHMASAMHDTMMEIQRLVGSVKSDVIEVKGDVETAVDVAPKAEKERAEIKTELKKLSNKLGKAPKVVTVKVPVVVDPTRPVAPAAELKKESPRKVFGK